MGGAAAARPSDAPAWMAVAPWKLILMSIATVNLYQLYWFYKQWRAVRDSGDDVRPVARAIFGVIFCYPLFQRVVTSAAAMAAPSAEPVFLAAVYIVLCISAQFLPFPYAMLAGLSVVPLAVIQRVANAVARHDFPQEEPDGRLTAANGVGILLGCVFFSLIGWALVQRANAGSLERLTKVAEEMNRTPHEAKNGIQLLRADAQEHLLVYHFSVNEEARAQIEKTRPLLKATMAPGVCRDRLLKLGVAVRVVYTAADGTDVATVDITPRDCR